MTQHPSRRDVVVGGAAASLAASATGSVLGATPPVEAAGLVSEAGGDPLADVLVSNGRDVVRTDAAGRWRLPVSSGQAIFVIKPSGFAAPLDPATNLPKLSYVHDPDGTPTALGFRYRGLSPTASSHLWQAALPAGLAVGTYAVQVRATDEYGRRHEGGTVLEVV